MFYNTLGYTLFSFKPFQDIKDNMGTDWQNCSLTLLYDTVAG